MSKTFLHVEYRENDEVKRLGAYWSREQRQCYVPAGRDLKPFARWLPIQDAAAMDEGLTAVLSERRRSGSPPVLTGKQAAFLIALACSTPPAGRQRWTMHLLADRLVELRQMVT